jgi:phosphatidylglycerophosphate synthase
VTLAVLIAGPAGSEPLTLAGGRPLTDQLRAQLRQAGARAVVEVGGLAELARLAESATEPMLLCVTDLVAHTAVLRHLATSPVGGTVALVLTGPAGAGPIGVHEERGQLTVAGSPAALGDLATGTFGGALRVATADLPALAAVARALAAEPAVPGAGTPLDRLVTALTGAETTIFAHRVRLLVAHRTTDRAGVAAAEAAVAAVPSDPAELRLAVKERDDFFTTYFVSTWSPYLTRLAARIGLGPTGVTVISVLFAFAAAALFGLGGRPALVTGAVLLYLGFVLDCVDGQVARYTRNFSVWGGWLDTMADRAKEYVVYAGLAIGVDRAGLGNGWALAIAAITLQTVRHMTDTWYGVLHDEAASRPAGTGGAGGGLGARLSRASTRVQADIGSLSYWLKRTVVFPIGERWALIALTVALFNPLVSLIAVLTWGTLAAAYTLALRTVRSRSMGVPVLSTVDAALHRDDGWPSRRLGAVGRRLRTVPGPLPFAVLGAAAGAALLLAAVAGTGAGQFRWWAVVAALVALAAGLAAGRPQSGALDWLVPAALRAPEYLFVIAVGFGAGVPEPLIFALLLVLSLHHYDLTARLEKRERSPLLRSFGLGWDGRLVLVTVAVVLGVATVTFVALAAYLFVIFVLSAVTGWVAVARPERTPAGGSEPDDTLVNQRQRAG